MRLVETYLETENIGEAARRWHTSRNVVHNWVQRYGDRGAGGWATGPAVPTLSHFPPRANSRPTTATPGGNAPRQAQYRELTTSPRRVAAGAGASR